MGGPARVILVPAGNSISFRRLGTRYGLSNSRARAILLASSRGPSERGSGTSLPTPRNRPAHIELRERQHPSLPRMAGPTLSAAARFAQHMVRVARRHGWAGDPKRLYEVLADRLGEEWTAERWSDAVAELDQGGGPAHVGKLTAALLARCEVTEPTLKLFADKSASEAVA